ncbi:TniQ family protein [Mycobacterium porcinum]|uniref:TniQ family protein n=1 Tax=Mycolicibacterium porcinum TaxID=39693 RepID=A0AAW5T5X5_9MYCO|nr:TniQ family protein [Mycolicibacterium porcinum]CDO31101.1 regulatory helix-turn-helix protein, lysR family [Mycolicibacterium vulneris]
MTGRRKLPVSVSPRSGEVLESWLGTLATTLDWTFGDLLRDIGSSSDGVNLRRSGISVYLTERELEALRVSTGAAPDDLRAMTMVRYEGHLVSIDQSVGGLQWSTWHPNRTRFCPACLMESGGRWQLRWRLPWVFVCDLHGCLLEDTCSRCGQTQQVSPFWLPPGLIPDLRRCRSRVGSGRERKRCQNDLLATASARLVVGDPLAQAHSRLSEILAQKVTTFGVYALSPASSLQVLADLRALSAHLLAAVALDDVDDFLGANRWCSLSARVTASNTGLEQWGDPQAFSSQAPALITGIGIALALKLLEAESVYDAGVRLRAVVGWSRAHDKIPNPSQLRWRKLSPALEAVYLSAASVHLTPSSKLRYRTMTELPQYPDGDDDRRCDAALRSIPSALWRDWTLRLVSRVPCPDTVGPSLSAVLLIIGTRIPVDDAYRRLGWEGHRQQKNLRVYRDLHRNPLWPNIATAIIRLHDYLLAHPSPVDYQRRRTLDYTDLLPTDRWTNICERAGLSHRESVAYLETARTWLFERVSGRPAGTIPFIRGHVAAQNMRNQFVERFTSELLTALDREAERFLHDHSIFGEPVCWAPPLSIVSDLELPGPDLGTISLSELHLIVDVKARTVTSAAWHFGVSTSVIRLLLERFPRQSQVFPEGQVSQDSGVRPEGQVSQEEQRGPSTQLERLRSTLTRQDLIRLHHGERLSVRTIAARFGVRSKAVYALASEYNVETRKGRGRPRLDIDPAWFRRERVQNGRSLRDIADEIGASYAAVRQFGQRQGIAVERFRPRRKPS